MTIRDAAIAKSTQPPEQKGITIFEQVMRNEGAIAKALPRHLDAARFTRQVLTTLRTNQKLAVCSWQSVVGGMMLGAQLGLELNSPKGHAYLVPFKNKNTGQFEATFIMGYKGIIRLAHQSGELKSIEARVVYENDDFDYSYGLDSSLYHKPTLGDPGAVRCYYGIAKFTNGGHYFTVLSLHEIAKHRAASLASKYGPWVDWPEEMAKKTCIRVMQPYLPLSDEIINHVGASEEVARFEGGALDVDSVDVEPIALSEPEPEPEPEPEAVDTPEDQGPMLFTDEPEIMAGADQLRALGIAFSNINVSRPADRHAEISKMVGREVASSKDLTAQEAANVLTALERAYNGE